MAQNHISEGNVMPYVCGATVVSGSPVLAGDLLVVPLADGASGETVSAAVEGVWEIAKATGAGTNMAQGGKAYWDDSAKKITGVASGNTHVGYAWQAASTTDTTAEIKLGV